NDVLPEGVLRLTAVADEHDWLAVLARDNPDICWDRLLFSAKESVFKAWFPLTQRWLGFDEAAVRPDPAGTFTARLLIPGPEHHGHQLTGFAGRWLASDGLLLTAIALPA